MIDKDVGRIADALEAIASAIDGHAEATAAVAKAIHKLGMADAATSMGAIESLGLVFKEELPHIAGALQSISGAIHEKDGK